MMTRTPNVVELGLVAQLAGFGLVGCGQATSADSSSTTTQTLQPVDERDRDASAMSATSGSRMPMRSRQNCGTLGEARSLRASPAVY